MALELLWSSCQVLLAYLFIDAFSGVYHALTDRGLNVRRQLEIFQEHHEINTMETYGWAHLLIALPMLALGCWLENSFLIASGAFGIFGQLPHYYAHRRSESLTIHRVVRFLQRSRLIISPQYHADHHDGVYNRNFCIVSGWNDWWINRVVSLADGPKQVKKSASNSATAV